MKSMSKIIFIVEYEAVQPLLLRTEGIYDVATRKVNGKDVPSIIARKMVRPLRNTLRDEARKTSDEWIKKCNFPSEQMCCYCIDCLIFGGTNAKASSMGFNTRTIQLRTLAHPTDALAVVADEKACIESETHTGVKEGRVAEIGQSLYSPFQVSQGTRFIGTFMLDLDKTKADKEKIVNLFGTIFQRTNRYGARTAQEGLVKPKIIAIIDTPYECVTSYDLYGELKNSSNWSTAINAYITTLQKKIPEIQILQFSEVSETDLTKVDGVIEELTKAIRNDLESEGISLAADVKIDYKRDVEAGKEVEITVTEKSTKKPLKGVELSIILPNKELRKEITDDNGKIKIIPSLKGKIKVELTSSEKKE
ncbi:MAG: type I-D CRISPR-associated protein Cas7/Csc2 (plasmid) [Candidatus Methanoperedens sp.]|nr:MAG: type I-D CRISPR-associated protein Cas7/Csc2 [Candidatus Methanoperedens sp.]